MRFKKNGDVLCERKELRFAFMEIHQGTWPVSIMCHVLQVTRSGFYVWNRRLESARAILQQQVVAEIREIRDEYDKHVYASPRIHQDLNCAW